MKSTPKNKRAVPPTSAAGRAPTARELVAAKQKTPAQITRAEDNRTYRQRYLDDVAPSGLVGRMVKFKDGGFITSDDGEPIDKAAEFIAMCDQTLIGWVKFNGTGEQPTRNMGLLYDGFVMPDVSTLPDRDESTWELGLNGQPADPWKHQQYLVLQNTATAELYTFVASAPTQLRAVGNLLRHYDRMMRTYPGEYPVIRLREGGFNHPDDRVGWVKTPTFVVVGHVPASNATKPDTSLGTILNDEIPPYGGV
jgi:hypothetical protein